jgi:hypothetical protein
MQHTNGLFCTLTPVPATRNSALLGDMDLVPGMMSHRLHYRAVSSDAFCWELGLVLMVGKGLRLRGELC